MSNLFPGMNPWLESPTLFPNLHHLLISATNRLLKSQLRPRGYLITIGERLWVTEPGRAIYSDVAIVDNSRRISQPATTAVLEADEPVRIRMPGAEVREAYLEILDASDGHLVTSIEFLSPANKSSGPGRDLYLQKQAEVLSSRASLVEIDLLRSGRHSVAVPPHLLNNSPAWDYLVCVTRPAPTTEFEVYPAPLLARLPRVRVPLKAGEPDAVLDLQSALNTAFDEGPFEDQINYADPPFGRLTQEQLTWCGDVVRGAQSG